jgi:hypothetical protein
MKRTSVSLDPYECTESLQQEITAKAQANSIAQLDEDWHSRSSAIRFQTSTSWACSARCDRQDQYCSKRC